MQQKKVVLFCVLLVGLFVIGGCGNTAKLDPAFDEATLKSEAEGIVDEWNQQALEKIASKGAENVKDKLTVDVLTDAWGKTMPNLGAFKKITQEEVAPNGSDALVVLVAEYENGKAQFTIGFDQAMKLNNFFIK